MITTLDCEQTVIAALGVVAELLRYRNAIDNGSAGNGHIQELQYELWQIARQVDAIAEKIPKDLYPLARGTPLDVIFKRRAALRLKHVELLYIANKITRAGGVECTPEIEREAEKLIIETYGHHPHYQELP